jgi:hypothetical protein
MVMPIYEFKCSNQKCKKRTEIIMTLGQFNVDDNDFMGKCKCGNGLWRKDQQINFMGGINMNSSSVGVAHRKYSNKAGGPKPVIDGKIRNDLKMPTQT